MNRLRLLSRIFVVVALWMSIGSGVSSTGASTPAASPADEPSCPVTKPTREMTSDAETPGNIGTTVQAMIYPAGAISVIGHNLGGYDDRSTKIPFWWEPSLGRVLDITVTSTTGSFQSGRVKPLTGAALDFFTHDSNEGRWMSQTWLLIFPAEGCWHITARAGTASLSFVVEVVATTDRDSTYATPAAPPAS